MAITRAVLTALQIFAATALLLPAGVHADTPDAQGAGGSYRIVHDLDNRFTIAVPATWKVTTSRGDPALSAVASATDDGLPASLVVIVRDLPVAITPETCVYEAQYVMRRAIQQYASVTAGPDRIGVLPAWSHAYIWTAKTGEERRSVQTCVTVGRRAILAIGTTANRPARLRDDMPALTRAIQSLHPVAIPSEPDPIHGGHNMSRGVIRRGSM
jgi:hypothetical protein